MSAPDPAALFRPEVLAGRSARCRATRQPPSVPAIATAIAVGVVAGFIAAIHSTFYHPSVEGLVSMQRADVSLLVPDSREVRAAAAARIVEFRLVDEAATRVLLVREVESTPCGPVRCAAIVGSAEPPLTERGAQPGPAGAIVFLPARSVLRIRD